MAAAFAGVWIWSAIAPWDLETWLLENVITAVYVLLLVGTYHRFRFSTWAYAMMLVFLTVHTVGSHYQYANMPLGNWAQETFHLQRNHYDRFVHLCFGLFMGQASCELLNHNTRMSWKWARRSTVPFVLAMSSLYELIESWAARLLAPEKGMAFLAIQGDEWDAQKDMTLGVVGAAIWLGVTALIPGARRERSL